MENINMLDLFNNINLEDTILDSEDNTIIQKEVEFFDKMKELLMEKNKIECKIANLEAENKSLYKKYDNSNCYNSLSYDKTEYNLVFYKKIIKYICDKYKVKIELDNSFMPNDISIIKAKETIVNMINGKSFSSIRKEQQLKYYKSILSNYSFKNNYVYTAISKNKVTIIGYVDYTIYSNLELSYEAANRMRKLLDLLSYFEYGEGGYFNKQKELILGSKNEKLFEQFAIGGETIKSIKLYKNRKTVIEFENEDSAIKFCKEFIDY